MVTPGVGMQNTPIKISTKEVGSTEKATIMRADSILVCDDSARETASLFNPEMVSLAWYTKGLDGRVHVHKFEMMKGPVTVEQFREVMKGEKILDDSVDNEQLNDPKRQKEPVNASLYAALQFISKANEITGMDYGIPSYVQLQEGLVSPETEWKNGQSEWSFDPEDPRFAMLLTRKGDSRSGEASLKDYFNYYTNNLTFRLVKKE